MSYSYFFFIQNIFGFDRIRGEVRTKGLERLSTQPYVGGRYYHLVDLLEVLPFITASSVSVVRTRMRLPGPTVTRYEVIEFETEYF